MKFRKKPVVIEAWNTRDLLWQAESDRKSLPPVIANAYDKGDVIFCANSISIRTLEGVHRADMNDKVICGVKGELYPCKPDIFAATYDAVGEQ